MSKKIVCIVAAHHDDEILGVGGVAARHVLEGDEVHAVIAADCRASREARAPQVPPAACAAAAIIGVKLGFLAYAGMTLDRLPEIDFNQHVERVMKAIAPNIVYTHHTRDINSDHRAVARAVLVASRPIGDRFPRRVLHFETPSSTEWEPSAAFQPNYFVDITATLETKLRAMACYAEELRPAPHPRNLEALRVRAAYWGQHAGCLYAEPFMLAREVV